MLFPFIISLFLASSSKYNAGVIKREEVLQTSAPATVNKTLLLQLVNDLRRKGCTCGKTYYSPAPPVVWNTLLEAAATKHSWDMYRRNYFSHIGSDGSNGGIRIDNAGYKWVTYGENIAAGYTSEKATIEGWIVSPEHCKNMMDKTYTEMGVGRAGDYWTQDFATR